MLRHRFWSLIMPIIIGIVLLVAAGLLVVHFQQHATAGDLQEKIDRAERLVQTFEDKADTFALDLEQARKERDSVSAVFPDEIDDLVVREKLFDLAKNMPDGSNFHLEIGTLGNPVKETMEGISYEVLSFTASVRGGYDQVIDFVTMLDSEQVLLGSLLIESLRISVSETADTSATMMLSIYYLVK